MKDFKPQSIQFRLYRTEPHPCSYLPDMEATTLFVDPHARMDKETLTYLSERGFRRSGAILYKPDCTNCQACISLRIPVTNYRFSRNERRILKRNADLNIFEVESISHDDFYQLYHKYISMRHADGDMFPPGRDQYESFFSNPFGTTRYVVFKNDSGLKAVAIIDDFTTGLSAVYTFYDPDEEHRSLGTLAVLWQILKAQELSLPYLYLGYWVNQCPKMSYKTRFHPSEIYFNKRWIPLIPSQDIG